MVLNKLVKNCPMDNSPSANSHCVCVCMCTLARKSQGGVCVRVCVCVHVSCSPTLQEHKWDLQWVSVRPLKTDTSNVLQPAIQNGLMPQNVRKKTHLDGIDKPINKILYTCYFFFVSVLFIDRLTAWHKNTRRRGTDIVMWTKRLNKNNTLFYTRIHYHFAIREIELKWTAWTYITKFLGKQNAKRSPMNPSRGGKLQNQNSVSFLKHSWPRWHCTEEIIFKETWKLHLKKQEPEAAHMKR